MADLSRVTKAYSNGEVTIVWKPAKCIHSTKCFSGLPAVFDPTKRPWVNAEGASTADIIKQVSLCPSQALSYYMNSEGVKPAEKHDSNEVIAEAKSNGPLFIYGNITVKLPDGSLKKMDAVTAFCRCGNSANKPFCDGSHLKADFKG